MNFVVALQATTFVVLAVLFARAGDFRLAGAQACYAVVTLILFAR